MYTKHSGSLSLRKQAQALPELTHSHPTLVHCLRHLTSFSREPDAGTEEMVTSPGTWPVQSCSLLSQPQSGYLPGTPPVPYQIYMKLLLSG